MKKLTFTILLSIITLSITYAQNFEWAKSMGGIENDNALSIAVDDSGNVYSTGQFKDTVDFDPGSGTYNLVSEGYLDIYIQKLDSNGNFVWAKSMGGTGFDYGASITIDDLGNIYTTGYFNNTVDFNPGSGIYNLTSAGNADIFIQKLNANGNFIWAKQMGGSSSDQGRSIAIDASGNVYTTGSFDGTADFDSGSGTYHLTSAGGLDVFIQKIDSSGNFIWASRFGGTTWDYTFSIALDNIGNIYTTGAFGSTVDFDPGSGTYNLVSAGDKDIFIQKLNANGNFIWAKRMGGNNNDRGHSIAVDGSGNVYTTGFFRSTVDFDPGVGVYNLSNNGNSNIFIQKLNSNGNFIWAKQVGGGSNDLGSSIAIDGIGNVYITGYFEYTGDFNPGNGTYNLTSAGDIDIFVLKLNTNGVFVWAERMGAFDRDYGYSITTDCLGNVYTAGYFYYNVDFDPGSGTNILTSVGEVDIFIQKLSQQIAGFTTSQSNFTAPPFSVNFTNTSNGYHNYLWHFGDGDTSSLINPTHIYQYNGTYTVKLFATDTISNNIDSAYAIINCSGGIMPPPSFITSQSTIITPPFNLILTNTSPSIYNSFSWDFGDGNTSNLENPAHTYLYNGIYTVTLYATDTIGNYTDSVSATISCSGGSFQPLPPTFTTSQSNFTSPPFNVIFTNTSNGYNSFLWNFGDGDTSNIENPTHLYTSNSSYLVTFFATDTLTNYTDSASATISCAGLGINTSSSNGLSLVIYPNPNKGNFTLEISSTSSKSQDYLLEVYSIMGKLIHQEKLSAGSTIRKQMNFETLSKGVYFIRLRNEDNVLTSRFMVE